MINGGSQTIQPEDDAWSFYDGDWHQLVSSGPALLQHSMDFDAFDPSRGSLVVFGSFDSGGAALNDTWTWDGTDWRREKMKVSPPSRYGAMATRFGHHVMLFGGTTDDGLTDNGL